MVDIEVVQGASWENDVGSPLSVRRLHWELLEDGDLWDIRNARVSVRRVFGPERDNQHGWDQPREGFYRTLLSPFECL